MVEIIGICMVNNGWAVASWSPYIVVNERQARGDTSLDPGGDVSNSSCHCVLPLTQQRLSRENRQVVWTGLDGIWRCVLRSNHFIHIAARDFRAPGLARKKSAKLPPKNRQHFPFPGLSFLYCLSDCQVRRREIVEFQGTRSRFRPGDMPERGAHGSKQPIYS